MGEDMPAAALATKHKLVHNQTFRRLFYELLGQVYYVFSRRTLGQLQLTHFRQIVVVLVSKHLTASKAFNWDNHLILDSTQVLQGLYITVIDFVYQFCGELTNHSGQFPRQLPW